MKTEHQLFLANREVEQRHQWAAEERKARHARREEAQYEAEQEQEQKSAQGGFGWLRRLAGAR